MQIKRLSFLIPIVILIQSCATKNEILYFQNANNYVLEKINFENPLLQPNDILDINVSALVPETAIPYNKQVPGNVNTSVNLDILKLKGYLVSTEGTIKFPVLGEINVSNLSIIQLEKKLEQALEKGGHLIKPTVSARLLNGKITILGEVKNPGTYTFTEQSLTLTQALGLAGDLTIYGNRKDVLLIREENGERSVTHLDLTSATLFNSPYYYIRPNDSIVINPNTAKVKSAGVIGNAGTVLTILSIILTSIVLITR